MFPQRTRLVGGILRFEDCLAKKRHSQDETWKSHFNPEPFYDRNMSSGKGLKWTSAIAKSIGRTILDGHADHEHFFCKSLQVALQLTGLSSLVLFASS